MDPTAPHAALDDVENVDEDNLPIHAHGANQETWASPVSQFLFETAQNLHRGDDVMSRCHGVRNPCETYLSTWGLKV